MKGETEGVGPEHGCARPSMRAIRASTIVVAAILALSGVAASSPVAAQTGGCAPATTLPDGALALDCGAGLKIVVEPTTRYRVEESQGRVDRLVVDRGAALVEFRRPGGFQILTPRAVASVRGTVFAVDVTGAATAVLTVEGAVAVTPRAGGEGVVLHANEGADVTGPGPLRATRWGAERIAALLARLGR